ncbi:hypothetical protein ES707_22073 [subsurface metagenome]
MVINSGAFSPGTRAQSIITSASLAKGARASCSFLSHSGGNDLAYPPSPSAISLGTSHPASLAPRLRLASRAAARISTQDTTLPSLLAVATACSPTTPIPTTRKLAGGVAPTAVPIMGMNFGSRWAAISIDLYPATVLILLRASISWAREILGIASIEKAVIPCLHSCCTIPWLAGAAGWRNVTSTVPPRIMEISCSPILSLSIGSFTLRMTWAFSYSSLTSEIISAPASR